MNEAKLFRLVWLAFQNALRLHEDSQILYHRKSYPSAFFVSVLAAEEYGKMQMLDFLYENNYQSDPDVENQVLREIYSHMWKQHHFRQDVWSFLFGGSLHRKLPVDNLESLKQKAIYVGLPRSKRKINLRGRIIAPFDVSAKQAQKQITLLNDLLLERVLGVRAGYYSWDTLEVEGFSKKRFADRLMNRWTYSGRAAIKRFKKRYRITGRRAIA
ncbi:MAG: AbiV family abortive infection protein [Bacteroidota bacterium]|nr:AbiV family abortive infection protein [Bacteroidota bacterium]